MEMAGIILTEYEAVRYSDRPEAIYIDAIGIGEGAAGQNSRFMIDVPHNINAKGHYLSSIKKDKDDKICW